MLGSGWDGETDVVVVGSGAGGMAAALAASEAGLDVTVLEKTEFFGGSTAVSGGAIWIPGNPLMEGSGHEDSRASVMRYLEQTLGNRMRRDMVEAFLDAGPKMVRFMQTKTALELVARPYSPDYQDLQGASLGGRTLDAATFDGRELGSHLGLLRAPLHTFLVFGGMMVNKKDIDSLVTAHRSFKSFRDSAKLVLRYARDRLRYPRGTRLLLGNAVAGRLLKSALDRGIALKRNADVRELVVRDGRVEGVVIVEGGRMQRLRARRGIVLAAGGTPQSRAWREAALPHPGRHRSMAPAGNTGDGIRLAAAAGGAVETEAANGAFLTPVSIHTGPNGRETVFPHLVTDRQKPGLIAVNATGRRFTNEADAYHSFVEAMYRANESAPSVPCHLVCDRAFLRRYGLGLARPWPYPIRRLVADGYLLEAPTIEGLAEKIGVDPAALAGTVRRHNRFAETGVDEDFGKGASEYNRYLGDPSHKPNPCLGPIASAPFYAVTVWPGDIGSSLGLKTDVDCRVLREDGSAIAGLYACGNDMNSIMAGNYPAAGITLGPALTFGYIAGRSLAGLAA